MNSNRKTILVSLASLALLASCGSLAGVNSDSSAGDSSFIGEVKTITIDGGGDIANFNTTPSMTPSESNPYPYNTLETLCKEWEATHPGYKVKINKTSSAGDRSVLLPQLKSRTSADIIYQNGTVVNTDLGQDFYVDLTDYLDSPNPYLGGEKWNTVYNQGELATTMAADGKYYYVNLEKIPVCFMYNKTLLKAAGVNNPESISTYGQLVDAMDKLQTHINTLDASYAAYTTTYTWYQIAMESNLFSDLVEKGDVLRANNMIDTEEMCRLYKRKEFNPSAGISNPQNAGDAANTFENNAYYEYIRLIKNLDQYKAPSTYAAVSGWLAGKVGFLEATGAQLRSLSAQADGSYEWGTIAFPDITAEDTPYAKEGVVRGSAGLATSWWVSNHAMDNGTVDACVDLLMYLTAPEQNNRLIGDLKGGIPLNPSEDFVLADYLKPLVEQYDADILEAQQGNRVYWGSFNSWAVLGISYSNLFIRTMQDMDAGIVDEKQATCTLAKSLKSTVEAYIVEYDYDTSEWGI